MNDLKYIWKGLGWIFDTLCVVYYIIAGYLASVLSQVKLPEPSDTVKDYFFWSLIILILARAFQLVMNAIFDRRRREDFKDHINNNKHRNRDSKNRDR